MDVDKKGEFTKEELEILDRKFGGKDPTFIPHPDPEFTYRFIRQDYPNHPNIEKKKGEGYVVVNDKKEIEKLGLTQGQDGCVRIPPDVVLAKRSRRLSDEIRRRIQDENRKLRHLHSDYVKEAAEKLSKELGVAVPVIMGDSPLGKEER